MPDYKKMYFQLFNRVTDAIHLLEEGQQLTEESYISELPPALEEAENHDK